jgi:hypothetical protein
MAVNSDHNISIQQLINKLLGVEIKIETLKNGPISPLSFKQTKMILWCVQLALPLLDYFLQPKYNNPTPNHLFDLAKTFEMMLTDLPRKDDKKRKINNADLCIIIMQKTCR